MHCTEFFSVLAHYKKKIKIKKLALCNYFFYCPCRDREDWVKHGSILAKDYWVSQSPVSTSLSASVCVCVCVVCCVCVCVCVCVHMCVCIKGLACSADYAHH